MNNFLAQINSGFGKYTKYVYFFSVVDNEKAVAHPPPPPPTYSQHHSSKPIPSPIKTYQSPQSSTSSVSSALVRNLPPHIAPASKPKDSYFLLHVFITLEFVGFTCCGQQAAGKHRPIQGQNTIHNSAARLERDTDSSPLLPNTHNFPSLVLTCFEISPGVVPK